MKRRMKSFFCVSALAGLTLASGLQAQGTKSTADNTKANKGDSSSQSTTADKAAKNNLSDRQVEAHIRREVFKDKALSMYAHNVKIVSANGKVTLRGPVRSEQEKERVEQYAKKYAADQNVINELTVSPKS